MPAHHHPAATHSHSDHDSHDGCRAHAGCGHDHTRASCEAEGEGDACCATALSLAADAHDHHDPAQKSEYVWLAVALGLALVAEVISFVYGDATPWMWVGMVFAGIAIVLSGRVVFRQGLRALLKGDLNINALMTVAVTGAFVIGEWPEAAMVMSLYSLAELIEHRSVDRARNAIATLLDLSPQVAERRTTDGVWERISVADVRIGDIVRVRPGERIPLDGQVTEGSGAVDQASVTGESMPVDKGPGDPVYAGTLNVDGGIEFRATAAAGNTLLARIIHAVEEAQGNKAPTQRFIDRFARFYTPSVFALAVLVAVTGPLLFGYTWLDSVYRALVLLVISCPCALVISTPVTVVSALAAGARRGILIKGGAYLETARSIGVVALDKTGTLTEGKPALAAECYFDCPEGEEGVKRIAAALAARSDHPVSRAIAQGLPPSDVAVRDFRAAPGFGIFGQVEGQQWVIASARKIRELGYSVSAFEEAMQGYVEAGHTVSILAGPRGVAALFAVIDGIRPASRQAVEELKQLGVRPVMLTGDHEATARAVAAKVGIEHLRAGLLPLEKQHAIRDLAAPGRLTAMVGDGINDAPALASADIGFAMGGAGTHTAMEAADVVVMNDDLRRVPETIRLSRRTHKVLWQNIGLALGIKAVFLTLAMFDQATMWMAVFADMGASLLVVGNGVRLVGTHLNS